jgi:hypothetical protein
MFSERNSHYYILVSDVLGHKQWVWAAMKMVMMNPQSHIWIEDRSIVRIA